MDDVAFFPSFPVHQEARLLFSQPGVANASARKAAINKALEALASSSSLSYSSRSPAAAPEEEEEEDPLPASWLDHPKDFSIQAAGPRETRTASASVASSIDSPPSAIVAAAASAVALACEEPHGGVASLPIERKSSVAELAARFSGNGNEGGVFSTPGVFRSSASGAGVSSAPTGGVTTTTTTQQLQVCALAREGWKRVLYV